MKSHILDLREERCPLALLKAKRAWKSSDGNAFIIHIRDSVSKEDIVRFFRTNNVAVKVDKADCYYELTVNKREPF